VRRAVDTPLVARFLADSSGAVMLEIYRSAEVAVPDYRAMDPILLHVAFLCEDLPGTVARLTAAGATRESGPETVGENHLAMLRDPWGLPIQLVHRGRPLLPG
jgi:hypothetical protein